MLLPKSVFPEGSNGYTGVLVTLKKVIFFCFMMQGIFGLIVLNYLKDIVIA